MSNFVVSNVLTRGLLPLSDRPSSCIPDSKVHGANIGAHLGPTGPRWAPCWPHKLCYLGWRWSNLRHTCSRQRHLKRSVLFKSLVVYDSIGLPARWALLLLWLHPANYWKTWWRHQMETFSASLAIFAGNSLVTGEFPAKGQWRGASMFSLICVWINDWVNNREAGDLRRYCGHYDVTVIR